MQKRVLPAYFKGRISMEELLGSRRLLQLVYEQGPMTQGEASKRLELSQGGCNLHFRRLEHDGLIRAQRMDARRPGRPQFQWEFAHDQNVTLGLVFDPPHLLARAEDFSGNRILALTSNLQACTDAQSVESHLKAVVKKVVSLTQSRRLALRETFIALPGLLDAETGAVQRAVNFPVLEGLDPAAFLKREFRLSSHVNSLGVAYYFGEAWDLAPTSTALIVYWDLGLGLIFGRNRQILTIQGGDDQGRAISELGHLSISAQGPACHCGQRGCLEAYAGGWVLLQRFGVDSLEALVAMAQARNLQIQKEVEEIAFLLGKHLAGVIQMLGVTVVRFTGVLSPLFPLGQEAFEQGLATVIGADRAAAIQTAVSPDPQEKLMQGATHAARQAYLYLDEFKRLSRVSSLFQPPIQPSPATDASPKPVRKNRARLPKA